MAEQYAISYAIVLSSDAFDAISKAIYFELTPNS